jgi:hypothetical protein
MTERDPPNAPGPKTALRRSSRAPLVLVAVAAVALVTVAAMRLRATQEAPPAAPPEPSPAALPDAAVAGSGRDTGPEVDPAQVPPLVESVSANPLFRRALAGEDELPRRAAVLIDNLAEGVSPRRVLASLAPDRPFTVVQKGEQTIVDPAAYARYDAFGDAVASVDAQTLARVYRSIRRPIQAAYHALGYPGVSLEAVLARALHRIEAAPVADGDVEVGDEGGVYVFKDARLEAQRDVEKHLLRMGPRNTRLLQQKAREIRGALGLPAAEARTGGR